MQTSNFKLSGRDPNAVAISQGVPVWFKGRRCLDLAPPRWLIKEQNERKFRAIFGKQLAKLDAWTIVADLGMDAILLCWEKPGEFCHRRVVAEWLEQELGITVAEQYPPLL